MKKNKIILLLSCVLFCALMFSSTCAYGDTSLTVSPQEQTIQTNITKVMKQDGYKDLLQGEKKLINVKINRVQKLEKAKITGVKFLSAKQQKRIKSYQKKIIKSFSLKSAKHYYSLGRNVILQAKELKKTRETSIAAIDDRLKIFKKFIKAKNKKQIKEYKRQINKTYSIKQINNIKNKAITYIDNTCYLPSYITIDGWSEDKINFVLTWGDNNWYYLDSKVALGQKSPMRDYSYHIAAAAYDYGIDPRLCAAISGSESGCGVSNCAPYNAGGGITNAPAMYSGPDAINKGTSFFKTYFGSSLTYNGAIQYSGGMSTWYSFIISEANKIGTY